MAVDSASFASVSLHLSRVLDIVGLNELTVARRRQTLLSRENIDTVLQRLIGKNYTYFHFGSQTEGTTTPGLQSDLDLLHCLEDIPVIQSWKDWVPEKENLLMLQEDTAPGYCRLQALRSDVPRPMESLPDHNYVHDSSNRVILKNTMVNEIKSNIQAKTSGPAIASPVRPPGSLDMDFVIAFRCCSRLPVPDKWKRGHRRRHVVGQDLLLKALDEPFFLVPVGHKLSQTKHVEWRISTSLTERQLMFNMNMVQIKCYVLLKMITKTFITPVVGKSISSYHCKTAVLHCIETFEHHFWQEDNLLNCIIECLKMLKTWVDNRFCPQFIIPDANLFDGKVNAQNHNQIRSLLAVLLESNGRFLLHIHIDDIGLRLESMLTALPQLSPVIDTQETMNIIGTVENVLYKAINGGTLRLLVKNAGTDQQSSINNVYQAITRLCKASEQSDTFAIQTFVKFSSTLLGSLLSASSLSRNQGIPQEALPWFRLGDQTDIASLLKVASVFYCSGKFRKVERILQGIEERFLQNNILNCCVCYFHSTKIPQEFVFKMYAETVRKNRDRYVAHCVRFTPQEKHCAPPALRHELFRSVGDDQQHRDINCDEWFDFGVADSLPYLFYLQYINYRQLDKKGLQTRSLGILRHCVKNNNALYHKETALNLLGQCMELEEKPDAAMDCYRTSLEKRPRNNAANWHIQNLRHKQTRERSASSSDQRTTPNCVSYTINITTSVVTLFSKP